MHLHKKQQMSYCCFLLSTNTVDYKEGVASHLVKLQQVSVFAFAGKCAVFDGIY